METTIAVVIAAYNGEATIGRAIESCLDQRRQPDEIIVVDDASSDRTGEIVQRYQAGGDVKYIRLDCNGGGPARPRNIGVKAADSRVVVFCDQDDRLAENALEQFADAFDKDADLEVAWGWRDIIAQGGQRIATAFCNYYESGTMPVALYRTPGTCGLAVSRQTLLDIGGLDAKMVSKDDLDLTLRLFMRGSKFKVINSVVLYYYRGVRQVSNDIRKAYRDNVYFFEKHIHIFEMYPSIYSKVCAKLSQLSTRSGKRREGVVYLVRSMSTMRMKQVAGSSDDYAAARCLPCR